jgi:L,D-transpeptidase ErfK/SrfK
MSAVRAPALAIRALALGVVLLSGGCALAPVKPEPVVEAPPPPPPLPVPTATHRFVLDPNSDVVGVVQRVVVGPEDTLPDIARRFNVGYEEIVRANPGVDPWLPGEGREVVVPTRFVLPDAPREGVVVNVAAMRLFYYPAPKKKGDPREVITHPIGIGKVGWNTPEGVTKIVSRKKDPTWTPPASVRREHLKNGEKLPATVPPGPDNPLGAHMFRLGWPSYLVHGTNKPYGVGMRSSHGCVRLYPEDIEILFESVPIGTQVRVVNQPYLLGWAGERLYVQAYGPLEDDKRDWEHGPKSLLKKSAKSKNPLWQKIRAHDADIDWDEARAQSAKPLGVPVPVMKGDGLALDQVLAQATLVQNVLPTGATWNGKTELLVDEAQYNEMVGERETAAAPRASTIAQAPPTKPASRPARAPKPAPASGSASAPRTAPASAAPVGPVTQRTATR